MTSNLLIVGNDTASTEALTAALNKLDFESAAAPSGRQALAQVHRHAPEVIILDTTALRSNARRLSHALRGETYALIILLATSPKVEAEDADLVLVKSMGPKKIAGRVRSAYDNKPPETIEVGNLQLDLEKRRVMRGSRNYRLTPKEFQLLRLFMEHKGEVVSRKMLMKEVWHTDYLGDTRTLDVHIRWLREKIEDNAAKPKRLVTRRGQGYLLVAK